VNRRPLSGRGEAKLLAALSGLPQVVRAAGVEAEYRDPVETLILMPEVAATVRCQDGEPYTLRFTPTPRVTVTDKGSRL
jgi:hypothetical protein